MRRLTDLGAVLSLASDLAHGAPPEHQLRVSVLTSRAAAELGLLPADQTDAFDAALLRWLGCTATAQPISSWAGDEIAAHRRGARFRRPLDPLLEIVRHAGAGQPAFQRAGILIGALREGPGVIFGSTCEVGTRLAAGLGYGDGVVQALDVAFERRQGLARPPPWRRRPGRGTSRGHSRGPGHAGRLHGPAERHAGAEQARRPRTRPRRGRGGAPRRVHHVRRSRPGRRDVDPACRRPHPRSGRRRAGRRRGRRVLAAARGRGLRRPQGPRSRRPFPSRGGPGGRRGNVDGAGGPGRGTPRRPGARPRPGRGPEPGLEPDGPVVQRRTRTGGAVSAPYATTARQVGLAGTRGPPRRRGPRAPGRLRHPHGLRGAAISPPARILQAADHFRGLLEDRPYRKGVSSDRAALALRREARQGRFDPEAVEAVVAAAGGRPRARLAHPDGLTGREVEVLGLLAHGLSNKQIAERLVVAPRTVGHHVAHIYNKFNVATRAGATLYGLRHDLVGHDLVGHDLVGPAER